MIFSLTPEEIDALYSDPSVRVYRPEAVWARLANGTMIPALCFNLPTPPSTEERNTQYVARLKDLADRIGLPKEYVGSIESAADS